MKKKFIALILVLTIFPLTLTSCLFNTYNARLDSKVQSYIDRDYVESLEIFDSTKRGNFYLIEDESTFEKALPGYTHTIDFDKRIAVLFVYNSWVLFNYSVVSTNITDGLLTVVIFDNKLPLPGRGASVEMYYRAFLLTLDKASFDSVNLVDMIGGGHPL